MRRELKILLIWITLLLILRVSLFFPHREIDPAAIINLSLRLLLFVLCIDIAINSRKNQMHVYMCFAMFFGFTIFLFASSFVGTSLFKGSVYSTLYYHLYVNKIGMNLLLLFAVAYVLIDYLHSSSSVIFKYLSAIILSSVVVVIFYQPFLLKPFQLYYEKEYVDLQKLNQAHQEFLQKYNKEPSDKELADVMTVTKNIEQEFNQAVKTVEDLKPYLNEGGLTVIFWKPADLNSIYINVIVVTLLSLFFIVNYLYSKPSSAYLDKILVLFFALSSLEIVHIFAYISSNTLAKYHAVFSIAHYVTIICLLIVVYAFELKLRFVHSATGKYYEEVLERAPEKITRWRDELDNLILKSFFNLKKYNKDLAHFLETKKEE